MTRWTEQQLDEFRAREHRLKKISWPKDPPAPKANKYHAKATMVDGIKFDSRLEARRYQDLKLQQHAGEISGLECHPSYPIVYNGNQVCLVVMDFAYEREGETVVEDTKGIDTAISRLKRRLFKAFWGIDVVLIRK